MMKIILTSCLVCGMFTGMAKTQLTDSKWKSSLNIPDLVETFLEFKKDTAFVSIVAGELLVEL